MTDDLIERLRDAANCGDYHIMEEAADALARCHAEIEQLKTKHGKLENEQGVSILRERIAELEGALRAIDEANEVSDEIAIRLITHDALEKKP